MPNQELANALDVGGRLNKYLDPDIVERGSVLPYGITKDGEMEFATPEIALEIAKALMLPGHVAKGGSYSPDDLTNMALTLGGSSSVVRAPLGSFGIFAGRKAATADKGKLAEAMSMSSRGVSRNEVWEQTGWFKGPDGKWRFEIDDSGMTVNDMAPGKQVRGDGVAGDYSAIQHPELAKAHPELQDIDHLLAMEGSGGSFMESRQRGAFKDPAQLVAQGTTPEKLRSTTLHELQHAAQGQEGFAIGGSPDETVGVASALLGKKNYKRLAGEAEARNVQKRRNFTPNQRKTTPPWDTLDVQEKELIVRMLEGTR